MTETVPADDKGDVVHHGDRAANVEVSSFGQPASTAVCQGGFSQMECLTDGVPALCIRRSLRQQQKYRGSMTSMAARSSSSAA